MLNPIQEAAAAMRQGRADTALGIILRKLHQTPSAQALNIFRRACRQLGLATFAANYLSLLKKNHPGNAQLADELAHSYWQCGDAERALHETQSGLAVHPAHPGLNLLLAKMKKNQGDSKTACAILLAMCGTERAAPNNLREFARLLCELGIDDHAAPIWRTLVNRNQQPYIDLIGLALCETRLGNIEEGARIAEEASRHSDGQARHLPLLSLIATAAPPEIARRMHGLRLALFAAAPIPKISKILSDAQERLLAIRTEPAGAALVRDQTAKASFICPIHRPRDVENAVSQIQHQDWQNAEAIFAVNSHAIPDEAIARLWRSRLPLTILDCRSLGTLGAVLNRATKEASGDFVFKFDADDRYYPRYGSDMILQAEHFDADLVEKPGKFRYIDESQALVLENFDDIYAPSRGGFSAGGATLCIRRHVFDSIGFNEQTRSSSDVLFHGSCAGAGMKVQLADPFNYLSIRSADLVQHTWRLDAVLLASSRDTALIGGMDAADRHVVV